MQIGIIGYGELGNQIHSLIKQAIPAAEFTYFDDVAVKQGLPNSFPFSHYEEAVYSGHSFVIALGYKHPLLKQKILYRLKELNRSLFSFIHQSCFVNPSAVIGNGTIAYPMCNIDKSVIVGDAVLLNNGVIISHNSSVGNGCYLSPGVIVSGKVSIGNNTFIGSGSVIANRIHIGSNVIIGIGTVVTKDIPDGSSVIGNPMKFVNKLELI